MDDNSTDPALPLLDLRDWQGGAARREAFVETLRTAARDIGFFYLRGHGVDGAWAEDLFARGAEFFALPPERKRLIDMVNSPHFRGYTRAGAELTRGREDWREQLDIGLENPTLPIAPGDPPWKRLPGPNQWPADVPALRPAALRWHEAMQKVARNLTRAFAAVLGQPEDAFDPFTLGTTNQLIKVIHYPGRDRTPSDQGCGPHKDGGFLTFLRQDTVGGLQIETDAGWLDAPPVAGTFVVNIGEMFEIASSGYLRATVHRVITPPAGTDRLSIAFFYGARYDAVVPRIALPADLSAQARGIDQDPDNPLFNDAGRNTLKGRLRSHPDVARRHYPDLGGG